MLVNSSGSYWLDPFIIIIIIIFWSWSQREPKLFGYQNSSEYFVCVP